MKETKWFHHSPSGSQHTAGGFVTDSADRRSSDAQTICHVHYSQEWGRLIAAAPELLQTLKGLMDIIDSSRGAALVVLLLGKNLRKWKQQGRCWIKYEVGND